MEETEVAVKPENHYVDNVKFYNDFVAFREANKERVAAGLRPNIPNSIGEAILKICTRLSYRYNFVNYPFREDMVSDAIANCITYIWNFDPEKSKNPFSYYTLVAYRAYLRRIKKEREIWKGKQKYIDHLKVDIFDMGNNKPSDEDDGLSKELNAAFGEFADDPVIAGGDGGGEDD
jgi:hypothetical protein